MSNFNITPASKKGSFKWRKPSRLWFMARGYTPADTRYTNGYTLWLHPETNDVLNQYGRKIKLRLSPSEKFRANTTRYLALSREHGDMYIARLKYLTFKGDIPKGYTIDHIDGNPLNNNIRNLRAVPPAINYRDGGFLRKLRNNGINVAMYPGIILEGFERLAEFKATHTERQYRCLTRDDLLRIFVGPTFIVVDPHCVDDLEPNKYYDPFIERD